MIETDPTDTTEPAPDGEKGRVQINYKSGIVVIVECTEFTIKRSAIGKSYEWTNDAVPRPMLLGVDEIESVWQL